MSARGIIESEVWRSEQLEAAERDSDPSNPDVGESWVRSDLNPSVDGAQALAELRIQGPSGVLKVPLIDIQDQPTLGEDVYVGPRFFLGSYVNDGLSGIGNIGFVPVTDQVGSLGSPRMITPAGVEFEAHDAIELSAIPDSVVLNVRATDYDAQNNKYVANIGPDVPDDGGDPTKTTDTVAGTTDVDVIDYNGTTDYSQTTQISSTQDVIAIVWTGKDITANDNDFPVGGGSLNEFSMNDDDAEDGWRLFRGNTQAVSNSGTVTTDYVTYSLIGKNDNEIGLKVNNTLIAGFAAGSSSELSGLTIGARGDGAGHADSRFVECSVITEGTEQNVDAEAQRQGSVHGTF